MSTLTPQQSAPTSCQQKGAKPTQETNATYTQHAYTTRTQQTCATPLQTHSHTEAKSKKKGKKNKSGGEQKSVSSSQPSPQSPSNLLPTNVSPAKTTQKYGIMATSTGLPVPPPTTPKLEKATPYEFLQVWNSLKNVTEIQPYGDLLKQIPPKDLHLVISNKLEGGMLNKITKCVTEKFIQQDLSSVISSLQKSHSSQYSEDDLSCLRKQYGV